MTILGKFPENENYESRTLLEYLFNCYHNVCLVPFKICLDKTNGVYFLRTGKIQKFLCLIFHLVLVSTQTYTLFWIQIGIGCQPSSSKISCACEYGNYVISLLMSLSCLKLLWFGREDILLLLESTRISIRPGVIKKLKPFIWIAILFHTSLFIGIQVESGSGLIKLFQIGEEIHAYRKEECKVASNNGSCLDYEAAAEVILARLNIIILGNAFGIYFMIYHLFLLLSISMSHLGRKLSNELGGTRRDVQKGFDAYLELSERVKRINKILGGLLLLYYFSLLTYFVMRTEFLFGFRKQTVSETLMFGYLFLCMTIWIVTTASYHARVRDALWTWLQYQIFENPKALTSFSPEVRMRLGNLSGQVEGGLGGLAISTKYFAITNGFLSTMLGVMVTYGIIMYQMQPSVDNN